ncbi:DUF2637 domain-containing protein, partial [Streptomyces niveus]|uniref:DUF2637 domain-containing protein n=1 Tax=Streptomyces niveus TaxID=193462 RepID=UPI00341F61E2
TADKHMEGVRLTRWILSPIPTFRLWRRMKLWELRSYDEVIELEQARLIYEVHLRARYGRTWRRSAPVDALLPLQLAKYGVPLDISELPPRLPTSPTGYSDTHQDPQMPQTPPPVAGTPLPEEPAPPAGAGDGRTAVRSAYDGLPPADQADTSARKLARRLAPQLGLKENTVRVYITSLRKERHRLARVSQPAAPNRAPPPAAAVEGS